MHVRILLVEDDEDLQKALAAHIEADNEDVHVDVAGSVRRADELLGPQRYHLVILDVGLPDGGGLSVLDKIRKGMGPTPRDAYVAVCSALEPEYVQPLAKMRRADVCYPKDPNGIKGLRAWVTTSVEHLRTDPPGPWRRGRAGLQLGSP